jgi:lysophospholipase L1-like esterase
MVPRASVLLLSALFAGGCSGPVQPDGGGPADLVAAADSAGPGADLAGADLRPLPDGAVPDAAAPPIGALKAVKLAIILGDSVAAGYNAAGRNGAGGRGFGRLMVTNHADFPKYGGHDLAALFPGVMLRDVTSSGAQSGEVLSDLRGALAAGLPRTVPGDVVVMINVGGNDFNDHIDVMIDPIKTQAAALKLRQHLAEMVRLLRDRYEDRAAGKAVVFLIDAIHDPTDGMATVPPTFSDGFCKTIQNPLFIPFRAQALRNLATMNSAIAAEAAASFGLYIDIHAAFIGHGMHSGAARFIDTDCVHPTSAGHDLIRQLAWQGLTGERY